MTRELTRGFTLIELMVTIAVAAIVLTIAVPSFESAINNGRLTSAANEMMGALQSARAEAIRHNKRAAFCLSKTSNTAVPSCLAANATDANGWITFLDLNGNGSYNSGTDTLLRVGTSHERVRLLASGNVPQRTRVVFRSDGFARDGGGTSFLNGAIDVCIPTTRPPNNIRRILIGSGGRMALTSPQGGNGACNAPANPS